VTGEKGEEFAVRYSAGEVQESIPNVADITRCVKAGQVIRTEVRKMMWDRAVLKNLKQFAVLIENLWVDGLCCGRSVWGLFGLYGLW
jgi:hypothetical protein